MASKSSSTLSRLFRPIILKRHKSVLISELFDILSRSEQYALPMPEVLDAVQKEYSDPMWRGVLKYYIFVIIFGLLLLLVGFFGEYETSWIGFTAYISIMTTFHILFCSQKRFTGYVVMLAERLRLQIEQGATLSQAMEKNADWFDRYQIETVQAGEKAGNLQLALRDLSQFERTRLKTIEMTRFMIYPLVLFSNYIIIVSFIFAFVMPKFQEIFKYLGGNIPYLTSMTMTLLGFITDNTAIIFVIVATFVLGLAYILIFPFSGSNNAVFFYCILLLMTTDIFVPFFVKSLMHINSNNPGSEMPITIALSVLFIVSQIFIPLGFLILIRFLIEKGVSSILVLLQVIPFCGRLLRTQALARFFTTLGMLLEARNPVGDSLVTAGRCSGSNKLIAVVERAQKRVAQGNSLSQALETESWIPLKIRRVIHLSEENETLPRQCLDLAQYLQVESDNRSQRIGAILEPFSIVLIGIFAFFVVASVYLPIFYIPKIILQNMD